MLDLVIKGGTVIDGLGGRRYQADVGVRDGLIEEVAPALPVGPGTVVVNATGKVVSPGFIDAHSHSEIRLLQPPVPEAKVRQGITTEVVGQCGTGISPVSESGRKYLPRLVKGVLGWTGSELPWKSMSGLLEAYRRAPLPVNVAFLVPHGALRIAVMGMDDRPPTDDEMKEMERLLDKELLEGAVGLSTGLIYPPCSFADDEELVRLCKRVAAADGTFAIHMRNEAYYLEESVDQSLEIARKSGCRLHISHLKAFGRDNWSKMQRVLDTLDQARESGLAVTWDQYPYIAGSTTLTAALPAWTMEGGTERLLERLRDPKERDRIRDAYDLDVTVWDNRAKSIGWHSMVVASVETEKNKKLEGKSIRDIAAERGVNPIDALMDVLLEENGVASQVIFYGCEANVEKVLKHPYTAIGTDGLYAGKPHPRAYGTYPRVLGRYVREKGIISLEDAVRKMTSLPASIYRLPDRGAIRKGYRADLTVFDPGTVLDRATFEDPVQYPVGIDQVIVNGVLTLDRGRLTGKYPGETLTR